MSARQAAARGRELSLGALLGFLDGLAELLEEPVVVVGGQQVTRRDDQRRPASR